MHDAAAIDPLIGGSDLPGDARIAKLAGRQYGVVARRQLLAMGFRRRAIDHRLAAGRLLKLHVGVYAVGHRVLTARGRWLAAVLACGPGAVLSHRTAATLWEIWPSDSPQVHVTAPGYSRCGPRGVDLHRARRLQGEDVATVDGIPVTAVPRTLLDLAATYTTRQLERAVEGAEHRAVFDLGTLDRLLERSYRRRGTRALKQVLSHYREPSQTNSELERRFLDLCRSAGLPMPAMNVRVAGLVVDAVWPDRGLVVELDGHAFHGTRSAFERDRKRDAQLLLAGYRVLRLTHRRLERERAAVIAALTQILHPAISAAG